MSFSRQNSESEYKNFLQQLSNNQTNINQLQEQLTNLDGVIDTTLSNQRHSIIANPQLRTSVKNNEKNEHVVLTSILSDPSRSSWFKPQQQHQLLTRANRSDCNLASLSTMASDPKNNNWANSTQSLHTVPLTTNLTNQDIGISARSFKAPTRKY